MIGLVDKTTRQCVALVSDPIAYDLAQYDQVPGPAGDPTSWRWDVTTETWVVRPPTPAEGTAADLDTDPRWQALREASPAQVEAWLSANVTDLASARRVLKILALGLQLALRTHNANR